MSADIRPARVALPAAVVVVTSVEHLRDGRRAGAWLSEVAYSWSVLRRAGWEVTFCSPRPGRAEIGAMDRSDPVQRAFLRDGDARIALATAGPLDVRRAEGVAALVLCGGAGALVDMVGNDRLVEMAGDAVASGAFLSACGHGTAALADVIDSRGEPIIRHRHLTTCSIEEERALGVDRHGVAARLRAVGARVTVGPAFRPHTVLDAPLISGQNPASAPGVARAVVSATAVSATTAPSPAGGLATSTPPRSGGHRPW